MRSSHETACHVIMFLIVELELALVPIQKFLDLLHDYFGPNSKKPCNLIVFSSKMPCVHSPKEQLTKQFKGNALG